MSLLTTFSVLIPAHASRNADVCALLRSVAGNAYFWYCFSRMRA